MSNQNMKDVVLSDLWGADLATSADAGTPWLVDDTSAGGSPTIEVDANGHAHLQLASTSEVENVCLHLADKLPYDIDDIIRIEFVAKVTASLDSATTVVLGLGSARADDPDAVAANAFFKLAGSNDIVCETDDGTTDTDDVSTGQTLVAAYKVFQIDFSGGKSNIKFYVDGERLAPSQTFSMANYSAGLQPIFQIQKTADTNTDELFIAYVKVVARQSWAG